MGRSEPYQAMVLCGTAHPTLLLCSKIRRTCDSLDISEGYGSSLAGCSMGGTRRAMLPDL
jgi:hypothetical protein